MPTNAFSLPAGWLAPAYRPSRTEIRNYAAAIARKEGLPSETAPDVQREAELQLWVWRAEMRQPARRRRAQPSG